MFHHPQSINQTLPRRCLELYPLTLQRKVHDAGVQGINLCAHVSRHAKEDGRPAHGVLCEGAVVDTTKGMERRRLCRSRRVGGHARLCLDLVVEGDGLQGERHDGLGLQLGNVALAGGHMAHLGHVRLCLLAWPPAVLGSVGDELVQLFCKIKQPSVNPTEFGYSGYIYSQVHVSWSPIRIISWVPS